MENRVTFERFGSYILLERLACGGMAAVYLARPATAAANGRILVVKRILPQIATDPTFLNMFKSETRVCMGFNHPNVVQIFDFGQVDEQPYIAMEYVEGKNLRQLLTHFQKSNQFLPVPVAASIAAQSAAALHHAHTFKNRVTGEALNIIHRDVSPQNILLSYDGNVKVIDFGIAKALVEDPEHTRTATIKGKISYLSPEQIRREPLDPRSDVFSLGAVLWELLTGQKVFALMGRDDFEIMEKIRNCDGIIQAPSKFNPAVPRVLDEIVLKALRCAPTERFPTAEGLQQALREFIIKAHPGFAYKDVAQTMKSAFSAEITAEQASVRGLNERVQQMLLDHERNAHAPEATAMLPVPGSPQGWPTRPIPQNAGTQAPKPAVLPAAPRGSTPPYGILAPAGATAGSNPRLVHQALVHEYTNGGSYAYATDSFGAPGQSILVPVPGGSFAAPAKPGGGLFKLTRQKFLVALLYVLTIYFLKVDREYMFFERFFIPAEVVRMAVTARRAPAATQGLGTAPTPVEASVMLRLNVEPHLGGADNTRVFVNDQFVGSAEHPVPVPVDQKVSLRVERPSFAAYRNEFVLNSGELHGNKVFKLDVKLSKK